MYRVTYVDLAGCVKSRRPFFRHRTEMRTGLRRVSRLSISIGTCNVRVVFEKQNQECFDTHFFFLFFYCSNSFRTEFGQTVVQSTYLVAFAISDYKMQGRDTQRTKWKTTE